MVLAHDIQKWLEERRRKRIAAAREQGLEQGRAEGQAEANQAWQDWLSRREEAESRGEPFTEPPPNGQA